MKYLLILAILAGSYYQFYYPKLNEESVQEFVDATKLTDLNNDFDTMSEQFTDFVLLSKLDKNLNVINQKQMTNKKLINFIKQTKKPKFDMVEKSEIEKIEIFDDKAAVTHSTTIWITVDGHRIKKLSRGVHTIVIQGASLKISELGSHDIKTTHWSAE